MAASSEEELSNVNKQEKECFMCMFPSKTCKVKSFSEKTWTRFLECVSKWKFLDGPQAKIAKNFDVTGVSSGIPRRGGFHQICYARFTDSQRFERAKKNLEKHHDDAEFFEGSPSEEDVERDEPPAKKRRILRSNFDRSSLPARSKHILPDACILCQKVKTIVCRVSGKRNREKLVRCSTIDAANLKRAAEENENETLLMQIRNEDCVAIEVKYHNSCYRDFTRYLTKPSKPEQLGQSSYGKAFEIFAKLVHTQIIENKEIMRLKKLKDLFVKQIRETHGVDAHSYKTGYLKERLIKKFPQLCFITPQMRSQGDIVYVNDISMSSLIEEKTILHEETQTTTTSETDSSENSTGMPSQTGVHADPNPLLNMYMTAMDLRNTIKQEESSLLWPPTAETLTLQEAERTVPNILYNFLAWIVGASEDLHPEKKVDISAPVHRKLLSISQDIISLASNGRTLTPKHLSLAMAVRHLSGSAHLIGLLNGLGHCVSNSVVLNHDTALAELEMNRGENSLPSIIQPGIPTTLVWDNNDFGEETLSGHGTTHNTNGIVIQNNVCPTSIKPCSSNIAGISVKRTRKRTLEPPEVNLATYSGGRRDGPGPFAEQISLFQSDNLISMQKSIKLDLAYYITKFSSDKFLPSWTGFNQLLSKDKVPSKSIIGYLPVIDGSPTEMDTVLTLLQRSVDIANKLNLETVVIVMDQAIYSKAQLIRWRKPHFMKRLVIRLGAFHTVISFLGCLGKRFRDAGLQDILIESEVVAVGSVNGVFTGRHYNRAVRAHKLVAEAMQHMRLTMYLESISEEMAESVKHLMTSLLQSFPGPQYQELLKGENFQSFLSSYQEFIQVGNKKKTFAFWTSYIDMVEILLLFLRGIRESDWELHLASVRQMLPWVFAYDHINYSRYLPVYWLEMSNLSTTHPAVYQQCIEGDFAVQRSSNAFAKIPCDQTIEQTANRDSKTKGGFTGFSTSKGAVNRWIWSHHARGSITRECETMAGKGERSETRSDLLHSRMKHDKAAVEKIIDTINCMLNPFEYEPDELIHIASGVVATQDIQNDLQFANARGESELKNFCEQRLQTRKVEFFANMKKMNLKTFTSMSKKLKHHVHGKDITLKADRNLLARLVVIGRIRNINLQELLSYSLGPLPLSLANSQGSLVKTNKTNLLHALEGYAENPLVDNPIEGGIYIVDGMSFIQQLNINKLPGERTFFNLAFVILKRLVNIAKSNNSKEIHFVTDTYWQISIKNIERAKRAASGSQIRIHGQFLPQQWKKFLLNGENKESLIEFLDETWSKVSTPVLRGVKVFLAHNRKCHSFSPGKEASDMIIREEESRLCTSQEEADTRIYLHASFAATTSTNVIIMSPDTDVFVIGVALQDLIPAHLYFHTGRGTNLRTMDMRIIKDSIGDCISQALIGLHCFTGCDSVSSFYGKGKKKALGLLLKEKDFCYTFRDLGEQFDVKPDTAKSLEMFVCRLYGQQNTTSVNEARYNMFRFQRKLEITMPPNQDALSEHIKRANYQAGVYKRSLHANPEIPSPDHHGWKMENGELIIHWMNLPPAPESLMDLIHCSAKCKKSQCTDANICTCLQNKVPCTDLCKCIRDTCCQITGHNAVDDDDDTDDNNDDDTDNDNDINEVA